jgi:hypothetical protein
MRALFRDQCDAPHGYRGGRPRPAPEPTPRERQILLAMAASDCSQVAIADALSVPRTRIRIWYRRMGLGTDPAGRQERRIRLCIRLYDHISEKARKKLFDVLEKHKADVEKTMRSVKGLVSYTLVRSEDGGFSVTVCNDKAGTDESLEKARDWIAKNAADIGLAAPKVSEGSIVVDLK